jgi:hypothetical protein
MSGVLQEERRRQRERLLQEERAQVAGQPARPQGYLGQLWGAWRVGGKEEQTPLQRSIAQARARESRLDALLGLPPKPPRTPKVGIFHAIVSSCNFNLLSYGSEQAHFMKRED